MLSRRVRSFNHSLAPPSAPVNSFERPGFAQWIQRLGLTPVFSDISQLGNYSLRSQNKFRLRQSVCIWETPLTEYEQIKHKLLNLTSFMGPSSIKDMRSILWSSILRFLMSEMKKKLISCISSKCLGKYSQSKSTGNFSHAPSLME